METADPDGMDCRSDQLFLAPADGCELGARPVLSRATRDAGMDVLAGLPNLGAARGVLSDALVSFVASTKVESSIVILSAVVAFAK